MSSAPSSSSPSHLYSYESICNRWLSRVVWKGVPKNWANSFLKAKGLIAGSTNAPAGDSVWTGSHLFYVCTRAENGETGLFFAKHDIDLLASYILSQWPDIRPTDIQPNPSGLFPARDFSSISGVTFPSVEALVAARQGHKLTHHSSLLGQNRQIMRDFKDAIDGAVMAIDIESWEQDHSVILEVGWAWIQYSRMAGRTVETSKCEHLLIHDYSGYRNGQYTPDNRRHFNFGRSETATLDDVIGRMQTLIARLSSIGPLLLVFHNASAEQAYFRDLGVDTSGWQTGFPPVEVTHDNISTGPPPLVLGPGKVYIQDTQKLFAASGHSSAVPQIGLSNALKALDIPARKLHNAGNDAYYTLAVYEALAGQGTVKEEIRKLEAERASMESAKKAKNSDGW